MAGKVDLLITREGNHILGNFYRVVAYRESSRLGEKIYAGYTKRESVRLARQLLKERGRLD